VLEGAELFPARLAPRRPLVHDHRPAAQRAQARPKRARPAFEQGIGTGVQRRQRRRRAGQVRPQLPERQRRQPAIVAAGARGELDEAHAEQRQHCRQRQDRDRSSRAHGR
jgi:hypothetical protein